MPKYRIREVLERVVEATLDDNVVHDYKHSFIVLSPSDFAGVTIVKVDEDGNDGEEIYNA